VAGMEKIIECVPNFSEGRDLKKIEKIVEPFRGKEGVKLLDYQNDEDHNRSVVTVVGEPEPLKTAVVESMGARMPLVAFNVNPDTNRLEIADQIAKKVRHISGGLRYCKGIGIELKDRGIVQVSMNMTDTSRTALYRVVELIKIEARRFGVNVVGSEIIGLVPMEALIDSAVYYLGVEDFTMEQVLEYRIYE